MMERTNFSLLKTLKIREVLILVGLGIVVTTALILKLSLPRRQVRIGSDLQVLTQAITFNNLKLPAPENAYLFNSRQEWSEFKTRYELGGLDSIDNLVDFSKESFIFINGGSFLTQGNYLSLAYHQRGGSRLVLEVVIFEAGKNCPREHLLNYPTLGFKMNKFTGTLETKFQHQTYECRGEGVEGILNLEATSSGKPRL